MFLRMKRETCLLSGLGLQLGAHLFENFVLLSYLSRTHVQLWGFESYSTGTSLNSTVGGAVKGNSVWFPSSMTVPQKEDVLILQC